MSSAISIESLSMEYGAAGSGHLALDTVSLEIRDNEFFTLLGPSGCGKTTLLRLIAGFEQPSAGVIRLYGEPMQDLPPFRRPVNTVFQSYALFPHMTVAQNIGFGLEMQGKPKTEIAATVEKMLALVKLPDVGNRRADQLSGGQQQRIALARALASWPRVLLLDEPLSALDARIRKHLREQIRAIQQELGLTTIFVTHDQEEALTMSDRIFLMNAGKIVQSGDAESLYTAPVDAFAAGFIGNYNLLDADAASRLLLRPVHQRIAIRPESIRLEDSGAIAAEVLGHSLLGNVIRYRVQANGVELLVDVLNRSEGSLIGKGQCIGLSIDANAIREVA